MSVVWWLMKNKLFYSILTSGFWPRCAPVILGSLTRKTGAAHPHSSLHNCLPSRVIISLVTILYNHRDTVHRYKVLEYNPRKIPVLHKIREPIKHRQTLSLMLIEFTQSLPVVSYALDMLCTVGSEIPNDELLKCW